MPTQYQALLREQAALDDKIAKAYRAKRLAAIKAARMLVDQHNLTPRDLFDTTPPKRPKHLYRNPKTGETWAGHGRPPRWIEGRDRKPFEV